MNNLTLMILAGLCLAGVAHAEPIKCLSAGKTIYTDDPRLCSAGTVSPIGGNVVITTLPNVVPSMPPAELPVLDPPPVDINSPPPAAVSAEDLAKALQTLLDSQKRGAAQAPEMPDEAK